MKVALYIRVSTDEQANEGYSLENQRCALEKFASENGWEIYYPRPGEIYQDDGWSGYTTDRPALKRLLADAKLKHKKFDKILVHKVDRFSRNLRDLLNLVYELEQYGIAFQSSTELYNTSDAAGKMMFQQMGCFAEFERNRIKERVFPGMIKGVEKGHWQGSRYTPYGYSYDTNLPEDKRKLEVVMEEAAIIKIIYLMYLAGQSTTQIAGYLYNKGYKTRAGGRFGSKLVRDILRSQLYIGNIVWNKNHYDPKKKTMKGQKSFKNDPSKVVIGKGLHEPIISVEDFNAVQEKLDRSRRGIAVRKGCKEYPLTGILTCGNKKCGHKMYGSNNVASRKKGKTEKRRYYRCSGKATYNIDCHEISVRADEIEGEIYTILDVTFSNEEFSDKRIFQIAEHAGQAHNDEIEGEISIAQKRLNDNLAKQERLSTIFTNGLLAMEIYKKQVTPLRDEEKSLHEKIRKLKLQLIEKEQSSEYQKLLKAVVNHVDGAVDILDIIGKKGILRLIFKNIIIKDGKIKSFEMYPPFQGLYEGAWLQWQTKINQQVTAHPENVSTLRLTDVK